MPKVRAICARGLNQDGFCKWQRKTPLLSPAKKHLGNSSPHQPSKWNGYYLNQGNNETVSNNGSSVTLAKSVSGIVKDSLDPYGNLQFA